MEEETQKLRALVVLMRRKYLRNLFKALVKPYCTFLLGRERKKNKSLCVVPVTLLNVLLKNYCGEK